MSEKERISFNVNGLEKYQMTKDDKGVWNLEKIYLYQKGGVAITENHFYAPMYGDLSEVLDVLKIKFEGLTRKKLDYVRTFESGTFGESEWTPTSYAGFEVEEYFVFEVQDDNRNLLLRISPVLLSSDKMIAYEVYTEDSKLKGLISSYLGVCAKVNEAKLFLRK